MVHLHNAWLPPAVAERAAAEEPVVFHNVVSILQQTWDPDSPETAYKTLKWVSLLNNLIKGKSELVGDDLQAMARIALEVILRSPKNNMFIQVRWGSLLSSLLKKHHKKLDLIIEWRPFYELLLSLHFKRQHTYEGWALKKVHLETITSLVHHCRQFFPSSAAEEVWSEFRPAIQDLSHNSSQEAVGFLSLFLPTKSSKQRESIAFFTSGWLWECLTLWGGIQNCHFWDFQWSSLLGRFIKHQTLICQFEMEPFLPTLFMRYLNMFEVLIYIS
ncbi:hypothetical protein O6H91_16G037100 [Diphasiastrum complanatum]|uniref:Uncharacterized protein n=1 Tax=Diphasiastrum complanatum TaxID=34168 RepID=A0ACC2BBI6_DIPCM|nr:hypothetical protein O6H91_16G037100 [Diphasiastrum complanatum]